MKQLITCLAAIFGCVSAGFTCRYDDTGLTRFAETATVNVPEWNANNRFQTLLFKEGTVKVQVSSRSLSSRLPNMISLEQNDGSGNLRTSSFLIQRNQTEPISRAAPGLSIDRSEPGIMLINLPDSIKLTIATAQTQDKMSFFKVTLDTSDRLPDSAGYDGLCISPASLLPVSVGNGGETRQVCNIDLSILSPFQNWPNRIRQAYLMLFNDGYNNRYGAILNSKWYSPTQYLPIGIVIQDPVTWYRLSIGPDGKESENENFPKLADGTYQITLSIGPTVTARVVHMDDTAQTPYLSIQITYPADFHRDDYSSGLC